MKPNRKKKNQTGRRRTKQEEEEEEPNSFSWLLLKPTRLLLAPLEPTWLLLDPLEPNSRAAQKDLSLCFIKVT
jgi:hypothetical protein